MTNRKLKLEIQDPVGNVATTHHFYYNAGQNNKLVLIVDERVFNLKPNGTPINDKSKENKK
jgi:hypothetical protein